MSAISSIASAAAGQALEQAKGLTEAGGEDGASFSDILTDAWSSAQQTDSSDKSSALQLLTGNVDDLSTILIDSSKAEVALGLTIQIRNKAMDAYNQIMNMQL